MAVHYSRGPQPSGLGLVLAFSLRESGKHNRRWVQGKHSFICCSPLHHCLNHAPHRHAHLWENHVPQNWSLVPKNLGTTALDPQINCVTTGQGLWYSFDRRNRGVKKLNSLPKVTEQASSGSGAKIEVFRLPAPKPLYSVTLPPLDSGHP